MIISIFFILMIGLGIEVKFNPRLSYIESEVKLLIWYNASGVNDRNYIVLYEG